HRFRDREVEEGGRILGRDRGLSVLVRRTASPRGARRDKADSSCPRIAVRRTASLRSAYVAGIHVLLPSKIKDVDGRVKPGHDGGAIRAKSSSARLPARARLFSARAELHRSKRRKAASISSSDANWRR